MYVKFLSDDNNYALVDDNPAYSAGIEIKRCGFMDADEAKAALEQYAKSGKWPNQVKAESSEKDV